MLALLLKELFENGQWSPFRIKTEVSVWVTEALDIPRPLGHMQGLTV